LADVLVERIKRERKPVALDASIAMWSGGALNRQERGNWRERAL
jgi:hypothetical protein